MAHQIAHFLAGNWLAAPLSMILGLSWHVIWAAVEKVMRRTFSSVWLVALIPAMVVMSVLVLAALFMQHFLSYNSTFAGLSLFAGFAIGAEMDRRRKTSASL